MYVYAGFFIFTGMTPLFKKLNYKQQDPIYVLNAPKSFEKELAKLPVQILKAVPEGAAVEFGMAFVRTLEELSQYGSQLGAHLKGDAIWWMCYPKKSSKRYTCDFDRDSGWEVLGEYSVEPVRNVAIDEDWTALRLRKVEYIKTLSRRRGIFISEAGRQRAARENEK